MWTFSVYAAYETLHAEFFPVGRFHFEAILEGDTHITRDLGIPYISFSVDFL